jgi:hypothetical protein
MLAWLNKVYHHQPQCIARPNLLGGHFYGGIIDVSVFNP